MEEQQNLENQQQQITLETAGIAPKTQRNNISAKNITKLLAFCYDLYLFCIFLCFGNI